MVKALMAESTMRHDADSADDMDDTANIPAAELQAAREAVASIPAKVKSLGGNLVQGKALQEAMRLYLVRAPDYESKAKKGLAQAGYPADAIQQILSGLDSEFQPAA